jgi:hypothetical protein
MLVVGLESEVGHAVGLGRLNEVQALKEPGAVVGGQCQVGGEALEIVG